jgi:hypothetical protein
MYIPFTSEMNSYGQNDGRAFIVSDTVGLENISPIIIVVSFLQTFNMIVTILRTLNHDDTTMNNNMLMTDLRYIQITKEAKK